MARKKSLLDDLLDILEKLISLYVFYLIYLWFLNRDNFWRWLIYGIVFFVVLFTFTYWRRKAQAKKGKQWLSDDELIHMLREMKPGDFENYIADLFSRLGYNTKVTGGPGDGGIDIIAEKDGVKYYIQCKKYYRKHEVGEPEVRDFFGAIVGLATKGTGYFITTNIFTLPARQFAEGKPIELIDRYKLVDYIHRAEKKSFNNEIVKSDHICPWCGATIIEKSGKYGKFLGCSNYPKCQYTENIKNVR